MKNDLATAIAVAIVGFLIAFFAADLLTGDIESYSYETIDESVSIDLTDPNPEVFNYRALNPTVEVYIGSCIEYNSNGECIEILTEEENQEPDVDQGE